MTKPTEKAIELLQPVLAWLDAGAQHKEIGFNMNYFFAEGSDVWDYSDKKCGAVCCIAGAIVQFNKLELPLDQDQFSELRELMEMTIQDERALFFAADLDIGDTYGNMLSNYDEEDGNIESITPAMAAETIRHWIKTGKVSWS